MTVARQTFVVQVHEEDGSAVLENVRTRELVEVSDLAMLGSLIEHWLDEGPSGRERSPDRGEEP
jgi:hypothetical protein